MDAHEMEAKINYLNWFGKTVGNFSIMIGDVAVWINNRDTIRLDGQELDELFKSLYDKIVAQNEYNKKEHEYSEVGERILGDKVNDKARMYRAAMIDGAELKHPEGHNDVT